MITIVKSIWASFLSKLKKNKFLIFLGQRQKNENITLMQASNYIYYDQYNILVNEYSFDINFCNAFFETSLLNDILQKYPKNMLFRCIIRIVTTESLVYTVTINKIYRIPAKNLVIEHKIQLMRILEQYEENIQEIKYVEVKILFLDKNEKTNLES